jgi:glucose-1-phosphate thymidylyltransferase
MKAVILCGGMAKRLWPFSAVINKHLVLIYDRPQVIWLYQQLKGFDVGVVVGNKGHQIQELFRKTKLHGRVSWIEQGESEADNTKGLAYAISKTERFADGQPLLVALGDQFAPDIDLTKFYNDFVKSDEQVRIMLHWNPDQAHKHTVVGTSDDLHKITSIIEKPEYLREGYTMIGFYCFKPSIYPVLETVRPNPHTGQMEFSDAVKQVWEDGGKVGFVVNDQPWFDCGTPQNVLAASNYAVVPASNVTGEEDFFFA